MTAAVAVELELWPEANKRYLLAAADVVRCLLERHDGRDADVAEAEEALAAAERAMPATSALERVCRAFGLSPFEQNVLVLCAGVELDSRLHALLRELGAPGPTFGLALATLPGAHWSALTPAAPLRYWRLVELAGAEAVATSPLRIDERVLHFLTGAGYLDERLEELVVPVAAGEELPPSQQAVAERVAALWSSAEGQLPVVCLSGEDRFGKRHVAAAASAALELGVYAMRAAEVPQSGAERAALVRLWERECVLLGCALLLEVDDADGPETLRAVEAFVERVRGPLVVAARDQGRFGARPAVQLAVQKPTPQEQVALWKAAVEPVAAAVDGALEPLVAQFRLGAREIRLVAAEVLASRDADDPAAALWSACRRQARPRLDDLAQRIEAAVTWEDLVLPERELETLRQIAIQVRHRARVYESWGFAARGARGLGISVLFHGTSGTGKTLAAEVLAQELDLDLYRIDLSQVVSKYIGETEKNLRRVFDAADEGGAILLFDEADALFGKRSEVKDSHDRYANIEVSYLLQRMEAYRGLAILTTNLKSALDTAFLRRLRFVVGFPFPDAAQRAEIWRRVFPAATPVGDLDYDLLARLHVAGGNIANIAMGAAFLAAEADGRVTMEHLLRATRAEYAKLERPLSEAEIGGWA
jgi:hypothetical protein